MNARIRNAKQAKQTSAVVATDGQQPKDQPLIYRSIDEFPKEQRMIVLSQTVIHPKVQRRIEKGGEKIDPETGAFPSKVDNIYNKLDNGRITVEKLITSPMLIVCGLKDENGNVTQQILVDGHHRKPALIRYKSIDFECLCEYFEATERELILASHSVNTENADNLTPADVRASGKMLLSDAEYAQLSDGAIEELLGYQADKRNVANWRQAMIIEETIRLIKGGYEFEGSYLSACNKFAPLVRRDRQGREMNVGKIGGDMRENLRKNEKFDGLRPEDKEAKEAEKAAKKAAKAADQTAPATTDQPANDQPAADQPATTATATTESAPITDQSAADTAASQTADTGAQSDDLDPGYEFVTYPFDGIGEFNCFDGVEFQSSTAHGTVEIRTTAQRVILPISVLIAFVNQHSATQNMQALFEIAQ